MRLCLVRALITASRTSSQSASLPCPFSPQAVSPKPASTTVWPRDVRAAMLSLVAACEYIRGFMAGQNTAGPENARYRVESRSSARPFAAFAMIFAVAGRSSMRSASLAKEIWGMEWASASSNVSVCTRSQVSAAKVSGVTKFCALAVITVMTRAPSRTRLLAYPAALKTAIPPLTPRRITLPSSGV